MSENHEKFLKLFKPGDYVRFKSPKSTVIQTVKIKAISKKFPYFEAWHGSNIHIDQVIDLEGGPV